MGRKGRSRTATGSSAGGIRGEMHKLERVINSIHRKMFNGFTAYEYDTAYAAAA